MPCLINFDIYKHAMFVTRFTSKQFLGPGQFPPLYWRPALAEIDPIAWPPQRLICGRALTRRLATHHGTMAHRIHFSKRWGGPFWIRSRFVWKLKNTLEHSQVQHLAVADNTIFCWRRYFLKMDPGAQRPGTIWAQGTQRPGPPCQPTPPHPTPSSRVNSCV